MASPQTAPWRTAPQCKVADERHKKAPPETPAGSVTLSLEVTSVAMDVINWAVRPREYAPPAKRV